MPARRDPLAPPYAKIGARGNKHRNQRRPDGPLCTEPGCDELWKPVCPNRRCGSRRVALIAQRREKMHGSTLYEGHADYRPPKPTPERALIAELVPRERLEQLQRRFHDRTAA